MWLKLLLLGITHSTTSNLNRFSYTINPSKVENSFIQNIGTVIFLIFWKRVQKNFFRIFSPKIWYDIRQTKYVWFLQSLYMQINLTNDKKEKKLLFAIIQRNSLLYKEPKGQFLNQYNEKVYQRDPLRIKRGLRSHGLLLVKLDFCLENMSTTLRMKKSFNFSNRLEMQCQFARKGYLREPLTHFQQKCDEM